jgi:hypothetical protein
MPHCTGTVLVKVVVISVPSYLSFRYVFSLNILSKLYKKHDESDEALE